MKQICIILTIVLVAISSAGTAGAFWGYDEMGKRAGSFVKRPEFDAGKAVIDNSEFDGKNEFVTTLTDDQISQFVSSMDLKYVDKVVVAFSPGNEIQVWSRSMLANARFKYDQKTGVDVEIESVKSGIFTVPGKWLARADKPLEEGVNKIITDLKQKNSLDVLEIRTENGKIIFRTRVTNLDWLVKT